MSGIKFSNTTPAAPGGMSLVTFQADGNGNISAAYTPGGGGSGSSISLAVTQTAHGFTTGQAVYFNGTQWAKAEANAISTLGIAVVTVTDANHFVAFLAGDIQGLSGLTAGQYYFVSDSVAGSLTTTEPTATTSYSNPVLFALSATEGIVLPFRPSQIAVVPSIVSASGATTAAAGQIILCNTTGGGFTVTLPTSASSSTQRIIVKKISSDANTVTIARAGADLIDSQTTQVLSAQFASIEIIADGGTNWEII